MKRNLLPCLAAALLLCSCAGDGPSVTEGKLYLVRTVEDEGCARFQRISRKRWEASYYVNYPGAQYAVVNRAELKTGKAPVLVYPDGTKTPIVDIREYTAPDFESYPPNRTYRDSLYAVREFQDVTYATAYGYWSSFPDNGWSNLAIFFSRIPDLQKGDLNLKMDVYIPEDGGDVLRPLLILIHGGAFFNGDKASLGFPELARHFAGLGYVVASVNYRLGFHLNTISVERAGYRAVQDVNSAILRILNDPDTYGADPERVFLAGTSAGAITALNAAFMRENNIPKHSLGEGGLAGANSHLARPFSIRAVGNMWGAVGDTTILGNARTAVISIHSTGDPIVPFGEDHPFTEVFGHRVMFPKTYGSGVIQGRLGSGRGLLKAYDLPGRHTLHIDRDPDGPDHLNSRFNEIEGELEAFFSKNMLPHPVKIERTPSSSIFKVDMTDVESISWDVEGGVILDQNRGRAEILLLPDAGFRAVTVSGKYKSGLTFNQSLEL